MLTSSGEDLPQLANIGAIIRTGFRGGGGGGYYGTTLKGPEGNTMSTYSDPYIIQRRQGRTGKGLDLRAGAFAGLSWCLQPAGKLQGPPKRSISVFKKTHSLGYTQRGS